MKLTRSKAIELSVELWKWLAETGRRKEDWDGWNKYGEIGAGCFLCEYSCEYASRHRGVSTCNKCPLVEMFPPKIEDEESDGCFDDNCYFSKWVAVRTIKSCKKYAALFLKQLEELK